MGVYAIFRGPEGVRQYEREEDSEHGGREDIALFDPAFDG